MAVRPSAGLKLPQIPSRSPRFALRSERFHVMGHRVPDHKGEPSSSSGSFGSSGRAESGGSVRGEHGDSKKPRRGRSGALSEI